MGLGYMCTDIDHFYALVVILYYQKEKEKHQTITIIIIIAAEILVVQIITTAAIIIIPNKTLIQQVMQMQDNQVVKVDKADKQEEIQGQQQLHFLG
jgi:Mg/Co/Ni transporter MgtE